MISFFTGTLPFLVSKTICLALVTASSALSSSMRSNINFISSRISSKVSFRRVSYPLTRSSVWGHTILPTYLFFAPCMNRADRSFSNSSTRPPPLSSCSIFFPNSTDASKPSTGDCRNALSVSPYRMMYPCFSSVSMTPLMASRANEVTDAPTDLFVNR